MKLGSGNSRIICKSCKREMPHHAKGYCGACYQRYCMDRHILWAKGTIYRHREKGYFIHVTIDELIEKAKKTEFCEYCGKKLSWIKRGRKGIGKFGAYLSSSSPTLDRKNNSIIIAPNNIAIVCAVCNSMKRNMPLEEWLDHIKKVIEKLGV